MPPRGKYDPRNYTWGFELEVGDVSRRLAVPPHLGAWEYAERDVVNVLPPYQHVAADPLGLDPPVGGEINTVPTRTVEEQVDRVVEILAWAVANGQTPTACCTTHAHVHVHVPGLREDVGALKRLTRYVRDNQAAAVATAYPFRDHPDMSLAGGSRAYLKLDGGRLMPAWMAENILGRAVDFGSFIALQCCGRDGVSRCRPIRYAINTYCLKHTNTVEFRCFRSTLVGGELLSCFRFVRDFVSAALNGGPGVPELVRKGGYTFPPFRFSLEECRGWLATKWGEGRGKKKRSYMPVA